MYREKRTTWSKCPTYIAIYFYLSVPAVTPLALYPIQLKSGKIKNKKNLTTKNPLLHKKACRYGFVPGKFSNFKIPSCIEQGFDAYR